jgi:Tfp pilus assembly protein PilO
MSLKKKIVIFLSAVITANLFIVYLIIIPTINEIKKISQSIYAERMDLERKYQKGQLLRETINNFEKIRLDKEKFVKSLILEGKELEFITVLEQISEKHNINQSLSLKKSQEKDELKGFYYVIPLEITLSGDFIDILKYLKDIEKMDYYLNISTINAAVKEEIMITAKLIGEIYIQRQIEENTI